jgi:hypothetical protein
MCLSARQSKPLLPPRLHPFRLNWLRPLSEVTRSASQRWWRVAFAVRSRTQRSACGRRWSGDTIWRRTRCVGAGKRSHMSLSKASFCTPALPPRGLARANVHRVWGTATHEMPYSRASLQYSRTPVRTGAKALPLTKHSCTSAPHGTPTLLLALRSCSATFQAPLTSTTRGRAAWAAQTAPGTWYGVSSSAAST